MIIPEHIKPIGWTRDINLKGYIKGTYDVLAVWRKGPSEEPFSNVGLYTQEQVEDILSHYDKKK
jgi:hypothetical protein